MTGASSGIGYETARLFLARGARLVLAARDRSRLERLAAEQPGWAARCLVIPTDITRAEDVTRLVTATVERWGRIDILVNNAGIGLRAAIAETRQEDARRVLDVNFYGAVRCIQAVVPVMRAQAPDRRGVRGQVVNVGSVLSMLATPRNGIYSASKFALRALNDSLRIELRPAGIDVILIMPGYTDTEFFDRLIRYGGPARTTSLTGQHPRRVAAAIVAACRRRRREMVLTAPAKLGVWLKKWLPGLLDWSLAKSRHRP